ncbi:cytochrome c oxidase assembly protein [Wolbachia endosymbiont of Howardula sp.]|uniref:cytochrome c oxidase assembly protein n=1 Tax=Wolbachia endosymbiont of Howardula sp. TaxID=2916816 RepID=UPI00217E2544|nr:cytochrome c oxidase assembly protein [Wolbachia endosymbiont of Howardula sp.]UWI83424.1 cytochrome c oxidase assembly protein [Wolbachia endosymbiont of Howardula sp.]
MLCISYASVPLYSLLCKTTGYGGTVSKDYNTNILETLTQNRKIRVRLNADIMPDLPWTFHSEINYIDVNIGKQSLAFYYAQNLSDIPLIGIAVYNVTPFKAGKYFKKIACFCFNQQELLPQQKAIMPVSFYIHPDILKDESTKYLSEMTLSYTFFKY